MLLITELRLVILRNGTSSSRCLCSSFPPPVRLNGVRITVPSLTRNFSVARLNSTRSASPSQLQPQHRLRTIRLFHASAAFSQTPTSTPSPLPPPEKKKRKLSLNPFNRRENITNIPNLLTVSRLIAAPAIGYLILHDQHLPAVCLLAYASLTDLVDGWIARRFNMQTVIGTVLDPMADKILMTILTVVLAIKGALPVWVAGIILGRDVGMGIAAFYFRWISLPPPKTLGRYFDFSLPSIEVKPTMISKVNTALQLGLLGACTVHPLLEGDYSTALTAMQYLVATTTVWSGASYIYTKDALRIIPKSGHEDKSHAAAGGDDTKAKL